MRLLIISEMPHHRRGGEIVGWAATVRELDRLATRFSTVRHIACLHPGPAPANALPYSAPNIELVPVRPSGGDHLRGKLDALRAAPGYVRAMLRELPNADMVHVRAPANIALVAMMLLAAVRRPGPRWIKYAGNWKPAGRDNPSYALQRWWLARGWHRGVVTVNGDWPDQPPWVRTFFNPSLDERDITRGREAARAKQLTTPVRMLYVGRVETPKGAGRAVQVLSALRERGVAASLELIGDGDERARFEQEACERGLDARFLGWQSPDQVAEAYTRAHVLLLPTTASEGWPKVLSEGMAYGVVPVAGAVSSIPQYLGQLGIGAAHASDDIEAFASTVAAYAATPARWADESRRAVDATRWFSFDHYLASIDQLLTDLKVA